MKVPFLFKLAMVTLLVGGQSVLAQREEPCRPGDVCEQKPSAGDEVRDTPPTLRGKALIPIDEKESGDRVKKLRRERPEEPPLEFEKYVEKSLGHPLPFYGRSLFEEAPSTFAPLKDVPVPADYVIGPGDELLLRVWGQVQLEARATVDRTGLIFVPKVGAIPVAGVHYADLHAHLQTMIQRIYRDFELNVSLGQLRSMQVMLVGQARTPGSYTVSSLSTLVNALFACGGPSARGSLRGIELRRAGKTVASVDLYALLLRGDNAQDVSLLPGDVIYIPPVGPLIAVDGSVNAPGIYELRPGSTLEEGLAVAAGLAATADGAHASVERIEERRVRSVHEVPLSESGFALKDGDIVRLVAVSAEMENAVTLRGNVARPGRYPWRAGMRVHDLIPDRKFLLTRQFWDAKSRLVRDDDQNLWARAVPEVNWEYASVERSNATDLSPEILPFHLAKAMEGEPTDNLELQPGDVVTVYSDHDLQVPNERRTKLVRLEGEVAAPGVYRALPGETLRQLVTRVGLAEGSYLYGAEFQRESTRVQQQRAMDRMLSELEKRLSDVRAERSQSGSDRSAESAADQARESMVARLRTLKASGRIVLAMTPEATGVDAFPTIALEDGDRLVVPHAPATVAVSGEVFNPGAFVHEKKLRVQDYLNDAGGSTRDADSARMFVLRADGTVVNHQQAGRTFRKLALYPGDTIVVPPRLERGTMLRGLRDWSQVVAQFALGAAAVKVLQ